MMVRSAISLRSREHFAFEETETAFADNERQLQEFGRRAGMRQKRCRRRLGEIDEAAVVPEIVVEQLGMRSRPSPSTIRRSKWRARKSVR